MATSTTHYGLNIAQGSDIVNPLVDTFPNFTKIDDAMWANKLGGVVVGTHLLSDSVHAITISDAEGFSMFRFIATAQFTEGQTFTVNGTPVTALTTAGTTLGTGCFVVNQNVLCCLVGTQLTLYVENVSGTAADSEKLGGQLPSYYATQTELTGVQAIANNALSTANSANTTASGASATASEAQQTANQALAALPVKIWTNNNPTSAMNAQTIQADFSPYTHFIICWNWFTNEASTMTSGSMLIPAGGKARLSSCIQFNSYRDVSFSSSGAVVTDARRYDQYNGTSNRIDNTCCIPTAIYGIKM